jgi:hypothetical protein
MAVALVEASMLPGAMLTAAAIAIRTIAPTTVTGISYMIRKKQNKTSAASIPIFMKSKVRPEDFP